MTTDKIQVADLVSFMQDNMGMNPMTIYCQFTGKPIGRVYQDEVEAIVESHTSLEEAADDMFLRVLGSMRPSLHWNVMRESSLDEMAKSRPTETLAYLLNRLFQRPEHLKTPLVLRLDDQHSRIQMWAWIQAQSPFVLSYLYARLIEIDAKMNLSQQSCGMAARDLFDNFDSFIENFGDWYDRMIARWRASQKAEEDSRRWFKGNTVARPAYFSSWLEAKPESKTAKAKKEKAKANTELDSLFAAVMEAANDKNAESPAPVIETKPVGTTKAPAWLRKKGAN